MQGINFTLAAFALSLAIALPQAALGQQGPCAKREDVVEKLGAKYGERLAGRGVASPTMIFELYASNETGTWTLLRTDTAGISCVLMTGDVWESHDPTTDQHASWQR